MVNHDLQVGDKVRILSRDEIEEYVRTTGDGQRSINGSIYIRSEACSFVPKMDFLSGRFGIITEIRGADRGIIRLDGSVGQGGWALTPHMLEKVCEDTDAAPEIPYEKLISLLGGVEFEA